MTRSFLTMTQKYLLALWAGYLFSISSISSSYADTALANKGFIDHAPLYTNNGKDSLNNSTYRLPNLDGSNYFLIQSKKNSKSNSQATHLTERKTQKQRFTDQLKKHAKWTLMKGSTDSSSHSLSFNPFKQELVGKMQRGDIQYYFKASENKALFAANYRF